MFKKLGIEIEWHRPQHARFTANLGVEFKDFKKNARDYLIGGHASTHPRQLITYNKEDFWFLGNRVHEPYDFIKKVGFF